MPVLTTKPTPANGWRLDGLWAVRQKRIEVAALEDLRDGRIRDPFFRSASRDRFARGAVPGLE